MPSDNTTEFDFGPRSSPDLVASGELLNTLLLGLEHLRRRLQTAQQNRAGATSQPEGKSSVRINSPRKSGELPKENSSERFWFYADEAPNAHGAGR